MNTVDTPKQVAEGINCQLENEARPVSNESSASTPNVITNDWLTKVSRLPASERMSVSQRRRRIYVLRMIERYRFDVKLEPLSEQMLKAEARSYDQQLTYAGVPTDRLHAVYLEAMAFPTLKLAS